MDSINMKKLTGKCVVDALVKEGMKLGMGTGSTAMEAVLRLAELMQEGKIRSIFVVPTSYQTEIACRKYNIPLFTLNDPLINGRLDLTIDGADEVDPHWNLIKGGGGALLIEKIAAYYSDQYAIIVDESKLVAGLGAAFPVPVEVHYPALLPVSRELEQLGARVMLREGKKLAGPVVTKQGNLILDISFDKMIEAAVMEQAINALPGVMENGIFTVKVTHLFIGKKEGTVQQITR